MKKVSKNNSEKTDITFYSRSIDQIKCQFNCVIGKCISHHFPIHIHNSICIGLITKGVRKIKYHNTVEEISENKLFIINPNEPHAIIQSEPHDYIAITIKGASENYQYQNNVDSSICIQLFNHLFESIIDNKEDLITQNWLLLHKHLKDHYIESNSNVMEKELVIKALHYIQTNYSNDITVEDIARHTCLSTFHFSRLFKKAIGISPYNYLIQYRVKKSYHFLQTNDSIFDAAIKVGFYDSSHFIRTFFVYMGTSPKHYQSSILKK